MANEKIEIESIIHSFVERLVGIVQSQMTEQVRSALSATLAGPAARPEPSSAGVVVSTATKPVAKKGRKLNLSPQAIAARKLQGKYMGILRSLPAMKRERVRKVAHQEGVAAAIRFAGTV